MTRDLLLSLIKFMPIHRAFGERDLGQGRREPDFHGVGSRRQGVCSTEAFPTFRIKGVGQKEVGAAGVWQGREKR